jgi:hypothetical protein
MTLQASAARRRAVPLAVFALLLGAGCGAKVKPPVFEEDDPRAARAGAMDEGAGGEDEARPAVPIAAPGDPAAGEPAPIAVAPRPLAPPGTHPRSGSIDRPALWRILDAGPGGLLRTVEVSPFFEGSRFLGWRLDQIVDASSPLTGVDLAIGDVILAVNRKPIARPEHVMAIWQELRAADELVCQVWRGRGAFELRFAITPKAPPGSPSSPPPAARPPVTKTATAPATTLR